MECDNTEGFGFLKGLTKLPSMFSKMPSFLGDFLKLFENFWRMLKAFGLAWANILSFEPFLLGFFIFLVKWFIYFIALLMIGLLTIPNIIGVPIGGYLMYGGAFIPGFIIMILFVWLQAKFGGFELNGEYHVVTLGHTIALIIYIIILSIITFFKVLLVLFIVLGLILLYAAAVLIDSILGDNRFSKFLYRYFFACEDTPFAWYKNSRYDLGNKSDKGFFCSLNCGTNYRLTEDKLFCEKAPTNVPYYCPQPLLYNTYKDEKIKGKNSIISFFINNHPELVYKSPQQKTEFIFKYKNDKKEYYEKCSTHFNSKQNKHKNTIGKSVCALGFNNKDKNIKSDIRDICNQTYCSNGNYENFCYKYKNNGENVFDKYTLKDSNKFIQILKNALLFFTIIVVLYCIVVELDKHTEIVKKVKEQKKRLRLEKYGIEF